MPRPINYLRWMLFLFTMSTCGQAAVGLAQEPTVPPANKAPAIWIYRDVPGKDAKDTRSDVERMFAPYGLMPAERTTQIVVNASLPIDPDDPTKGTCIEYECEFADATDWMGAYTLVDGDSWGKKPGVNVQKQLGVAPNTKLALRFKARGAGAVTFKIGGIADGPHRSSLPFPREVPASPTRLTADFREYTIGPIEARMLTNLIDPFCMVTSGLDNRGRKSVQVQVDDIRLELFDKPQSPPSALPMNWRQRLMRTCFVAYTPTGFDPTASPIRQPSVEEIRADLAAISKLLSDAGIPKGQAGIITYGCRDGLEQIAPLADAAGLAMVLGIFNPRDDLEVRNAEALLARDDLQNMLAACCVGNEAITFRRSTMEEIRQVVERLRQIRLVPMTTTEIVQAYGDPRLFEFDFSLVNAHALFANVREPDRGAKWAIARIQDLIQVAPQDHLILVKEIGWPAGPRPAFTDEQQAAYWKAVLGDPVARQVNVCIFDGLSNVPWKNEPITVSDGGKVNVGPYWPVLFGPDRKPKAFGVEILQLWQKSRSQSETN